MDWYWGAHIHPYKTETKDDRRSVNPTHLSERPASHSPLLEALPWCPSERQQEPQARVPLQHHHNPHWGHQPPGLRVLRADRGVRWEHSKWVCLGNTESPFWPSVSDLINTSTIHSFTSSFYFYFSFFFRATPVAYGSSWDRVEWGAAGLHHSHSNTPSLTHQVRPGIKPASSWILVGFVIRCIPMETPTIHFFFQQVSLQGHNFYCNVPIKQKNLLDFFLD